MKRLAFRWQIIGLLFLLATGTGCIFVYEIFTNEEQKPKNADVATPSFLPTVTMVSTSSPIPPTAPPLASNINPLTGLPVEAGVLDRRPLAVKISNAPEIVRPQAGVGLADLVFEHITEGNLTRFTAIFYSQVPPRVGSVRSARLLDLEINQMYQSLFAYSGASGPIREKIATSVFGTLAYEGVSVGKPLYFRDDKIEPPHNLFVVPAAVWQRASEQDINERPTLTGMTFAEFPPIGASEEVNKIVVNYGPDEVVWEYNAEAGVYRRLVDGEPHTDALDGQQLEAENVIILWAHHQPDYTIVESEWQGSRSYSIEIQVWTLGPVTIFRDGLRYDGHWHRWDKNDLLTFWTDENQQERLHLKPGQTWFQVVPLDFEGLSTQ